MSLHRGAARFEPEAGAESLASVISPQLKRLLAYVRPYRISMVLGIVFLAIVALAEGDHCADDPADH